MEALVRGKNGLALRHGSLQADQPADQAQLRAVIAAATRPAPTEIDAPASLVLHGMSGATLTLHAVPVAGAIRRYLPAMPIALVTATAGSSEPQISTESLRRAHDCTRSEARLIAHLVSGRDLRSAAKAMGITYGTARVYLKLVFEKLGVHSQAQLVARVLGPRSASASPSAAAQ
jgi:DNA-binding CsgD family transcriptional regulator